MRKKVEGLGLLKDRVRQILVGNPIALRLY